MEKNTFLVVAPELSEEENNLLLLLRTLRQGIVMIPVAHRKPITLALRWPDLVNWAEVYSGPVTPNEREVLACIYELEHGDVYLNVLDIDKFQILNDTVQRIRLKGLDWRSHISKT